MADSPNSTTTPSFAQAIAAHKAAQAAVLAHKGSATDAFDALVDAEQAALLALAQEPCASDAELIEKLRYLLAHEKAERQGRPFAIVNDEAIQLALEAHFEREPATVV